MNNERFQELISLYLYDELTEDQSTELESMMLESDEYMSEYESAKAFKAALAGSKPEQPTERDLTEARNNLMRTIRHMDAETAKPNPFAGLLSFFGTNYKTALGLAATLVIGIFLGKAFFSQPALTQTENIIDVDNYNRDDVKISNIRFDQKITEDGKLEFTFDAVKPVKYTGTLNDEFAQQLLARALLTGNNPGTRLKTVNTIAMQTKKQENFVPDTKVKSALLSALKVDPNPAVRKEAINVLLKYPFDNEIRDGLLYVLSNDENSGLRVAAINALAELKHQGKSIDNEIKNALNTSVEQEENNFIRLRAASILKEVK